MKMSKQSLVEETISEVTQTLLGRRGMYAVSVPTGMGATMIVQQLETQTGARLRVVEATTSLHTSLERIAAKIAPELFQRQLAFQLEDQRQTEPVRISPRDIEARLTQAFSTWLRRLSLADHPAVLLIADAHRLRSSPLVDLLVDHLVRARGNLAISFLLVGNETFTLPRGPAARILPNARKRYRIEYSRTHFTGFFTISSQTIEDRDIAIMLGRLGADPEYGWLACQARKQVLFNIDYRNLERLVSLGEEMGGPRNLSERDISLAFAFPPFEFYRPATRI